MKKLLVLISSLLLTNITNSKETSSNRVSDLQKKLMDQGVLSSTKSRDTGKTGGGGNVGPKIQK